MLSLYVCRKKSLSVRPFVRLSTHNDRPSIRRSPENYDFLTIQVDKRASKMYENNLEETLQGQMVFCQNASDVIQMSQRFRICSWGRGPNGQNRSLMDSELSFDNGWQNSFNELIMKGSQRDNERAMNRWWTRDEQMMKAQWRDDEQIMNVLWTDDEREMNV